MTIFKALLTKLTRRAQALGMIAALCCLAVVLFSVAPALAVKEYVPGVPFGSAGSETGEFTEPVGVAVNDSTDPVATAKEDVYVVDKGNNRVERFNSRGTSFEGQFNGSGKFEAKGKKETGAAASSGQFASPEGIAVDNSGKSALEDPSVEDVYVVDTGHDVVDKFSATGEYLGELTEIEGASGGIKGVAVDPSGNVWVYSSNGQAVEFNDEGVYVPGSSFNTEKSVDPGLAVDSLGQLYIITEAPVVRRINPPEPEGVTIDEANGVSGVATDEATGEVYVDNGNVVHRYGPAGEPLLEEFGSGQITGGAGLAVTQAGARVYVADTGANRVEIFNYVSLPTVTTPMASEVSNTVETLGGTVEPEGEAVTECRFEYGLVQAEPGHYEHSVLCEQTPESITGTSVHVSQTVSGLTPGATYHYRLDVSNANGTGNSQDATFTAFPAVGDESFSRVGSSSAVVHATVEPGGVPTSYFFEYGTSTEYSSRTTVESAGASSGTVAVSAPLEGLSADTTYHFRVVASSFDGTLRGMDASFSTFALATSGLPDGRGYELISPLENGYAEVVHGTRAAADGGAVAYTGQAPEQGGNGNNEGPNESGLTTAGGSNEYLASRSPAGWTATDIQPPGLASVSYGAFSGGLSLALLTSSEALVPGAPAGQTLYSRDDVSGSYGVLSAGAAYAGSTPDGAHVLYSTGAAGLFESSAGVPAAVNVLPEGGSATDAVFGGPARNVVGSTSIVGPFGPDLANAVSGDGSRVFWTETDAEGDPLRLFVTEHAGSPAVRTVQLDASRFAGHAGGEGRFVTASDDGSRVFFTDCNQLTANSTAVSVPRCEEAVDRSGESVSTPKGDDLYEYDLSTGTLTDLTVATGAEHAGVTGVLGASADGSYMYFAAGGVLAAGASPQECLQPSIAEVAEESFETKCNVYMVHDGGPPVFVAVLSSHDWADWGTVVGQHAAYVAPDSGDIVFSSGLDLAGFRAHGQHEIYMYTPGGGVSCLSCNPSGALTPPASGAALPLSESTTFAFRDVSADGDRVFFETAEALVPQDGNGKTDVYEWERAGEGTCAVGGTAYSSANEGCLFLVSGGTSSHNSHFVDASESGDDVFFISDAELVPADRGEYTQLYDARVGATEALAPTACTGTGCQGVPPAPPIFATPASASIAGADDLEPGPAVTTGGLSVTGHSVKRRTLTLTVSVPAAGTLTVSGSGLKRVSKTITGHEALKLTLKATRSGEFTTTVTVSFVPKQGSKQSKTISVKFKG